MFKSYDELRDYIISVFGDQNVILSYIENAYEFGCNEGETVGFKQAMSEEFDHMDIDDLPDDLIQQIESDAYDRGSENGYHNGYEEGRDEGWDNGHSEGYEVGHNEGYDEGYSNGYDECKIELGAN